MDAKKRLLRDYKEIQEHPLENIAAAPLDENLFIWHVNLRGITAPLNEAPFHFIIEFSPKYPEQPPNITLCTQLPHPNVFANTKTKSGGFTLCMDMLEQGQWEKEVDKNVLYSGWSSAYSLLSMLVQLQSFFLDVDLQYATHKGTSLPQAVESAQKFSCTCGHKPNKPSPAFPTKKELEARILVRKILFVPKVRPADSHMNFVAGVKPAAIAAKPVAVAPASGAPGTVVAAKPGVWSASAAKPTTPSTAVYTVSYASATSTTQATAAPATAPITAAPQPKKPIVKVPEWTEVISKRHRNSEASASSYTTKSNKKAEKPQQQANQQQKPAKKKAKMDVAPSQQASTSYKSNTATPAQKTKPSKAETKAPVTPKSKPVVAEAPSYKEQDYVAIFLKEAAAREERLRQRKKANYAVSTRDDTQEEHVDRTYTKLPTYGAAPKAQQPAKAASKAQEPAKDTNKAKEEPTKQTNKSKAEAPAKPAQASKKVNASAPAAVPAPTPASVPVSQPTPAASSAQQPKKAQAAAPANWAEVPNKKSKKGEPEATSATAPQQQQQKQNNKKKPVEKKAPPPPTYVSSGQMLQSRIDPSQMGDLGVFPLDILVYILSFTETPDILRVATVARNLNIVAENGILWKELFSRHYPKSKLSPANLGDWKYVFMRELTHITDELVCFHTKHTFEEDILGVPINFTVNPVTLQVDYISSSMDIISYTAFHECNVRKTPYKEPFSYWMPLYITEEHFQRALPHIKRMLIQLCPEYRSSSFDPHMAINALPKLMNTMIVLVMNNGTHYSAKALNGYCAFHRLLLAFIEMYPALLASVNGSIDTFRKDEESRQKRNLPSLGNFIPLLSVSNKFSWEHVAKALVDETQDRNVLWICKEHPKLASLAAPEVSNNNNALGVEMDRLTKSFEATQVSLKLLLFHVYFLRKIARPSGASLGKVADSYDRFYGRTSSKTQEEFQNAVKRILSISKWPEFYSLAGLSAPTPKSMTEILRQAVRNSKKKKYHSDFTDFRNIQASGTSVILKKNDSYKAASGLEKVVMGLGWGYKEDVVFLDATCFEFNDSYKLLGDQIDPEKKTVEHEINISLSNLRADTKFLVFTISAWRTTLADVQLPWVRLSDAQAGSELCRYTLDNTGREIAVIMCVLVKPPPGSKTGWCVKVVSKFDEGRASGYLPMKNNLPALLQGLQY